MPIATRTTTDGVSVIAIELAQGNAIGPEFIELFNAALDTAEGSDAGACVITGQGQVFCAGLDLVTIYDYGRAEMGAFCDAFDAMFERAFAFPKPVVAAVNGHAIAGGCILAMATDYRIMDAGFFTIGITEVQVGLSFPAAAFEIARHALSPAGYAEWFLEGRRGTPEEARRDGVVQRIAGERGALAEAVEKASVLARGAPSAMRAVKADLRAPALARIAATRAEARARFLDHWFSPSARERVGHIRDELLKKRERARLA